MRVSDRQRFETVRNRVEDAKTANSRALERISTQKDITKLSDNPVGVSRVLRFRDKIGNLEQYQKNIEFSKGFLERTESALSSMTDNLIRAKELAIGMANDTYDASSREATAREIQEISKELTQLGNSSFNGRYVFGGFRNQTPPLTLDGDYVGDDGAIYLQVSKANFKQVNIQARHLFEPNPEAQAEGHMNMIKMLDTLNIGLLDGNKGAIHRAIDELSYQAEKTTSYQAEIGAMWNSLDQARDRLEVEDELTRGSLSKVEDADIYDASSDFKQTETTLQGTLMASTKLLQPSLLNFLQ